MKIAFFVVKSIPFKRVVSLSHFPYRLKCDIPGDNLIMQSVLMNSMCALLCHESLFVCILLHYKFVTCDIADPWLFYCRTNQHCFHTNWTTISTNRTKLNEFHCWFLFHCFLLHSFTDLNQLNYSVVNFPLSIFILTDYLVNSLVYFSIYFIF